MEQNGNDNISNPDTASSGSFNIDLEKSKGNPKQPNPRNFSGTNPSPSAPDFPDGGLKAWLQVLGAFCIYFSTWGLVQSFGVYQSYYELELLKSSSNSQISWIGATQTFLLVFAGVLTGPVYDKGYMLTLNICGTFLVTLGVMTTSAATKYYQIFLSQGLCIGLGCGCLFISSMAVVPTYFFKKRPITMGLASLGSGIGGTVYSVIFHRLQPHIGFNWTVRVIGFIALFTLILAAFLLRPRIPSANVRRIMQAQAFQEPKFTLITIAGFLGLIGIYIPFYEIQLFGQRKLGTSQTLTFYLIPIMNAGSTFGRLCLSAMALHFGAINMFTFASMFSGIICLCWISVNTTDGGIAFSFFYGFTSGAILSLVPLVLAIMTQDLKELGTRMGTCFGIASFGMLAGNPIAGALVNVRSGSFIRAQVFGGVIMLAGGTFAMAAGILQMREMRRRK